MSGTPRDHAYIRAPDILRAFPEAIRTKPKGGRHRWKDPRGLIFEWDSRHGALEVYNARGRHLGEYDHVTGEQLEFADPTREVEP